MSGEWKEYGLLRIFLAEKDKLGHIPLYEAIMVEAKNLNIKGATLLRGLMGFGKDSKIHSAKILRLADNLPLVLEMVDVEENLNKLLPFLKEHVKDGIVTMEKVKLLGDAELRGY